MNYSWVELYLGDVSSQYLVSISKGGISDLKTLN